jgi:hypothetical protein
MLNKKKPKNNTVAAIRVSFCFILSIINVASDSSINGSSAAITKLISSENLNAVFKVFINGIGSIIFVKPEKRSTTAIM